MKDTGWGIGPVEITKLIKRLIKAWAKELKEEQKSQERISGRKYKETEK